jgi:hypothetical protein
MEPDLERDWTSAWSGAAGLALSSWTHDPRLLADTTLARLLELSLEATALRHRLVVHAHVILPGSLHVVTGVPGPGDAPGAVAWPVALGRIKGEFSTWTNRMRRRDGPTWKPAARIRPLSARALPDAVDRCHEAPVQAGLVTFAGDWPFSSWSRLYAERRASFVRPVAASDLAFAGE